MKPIDKNKAFTVSSILINIIFFSMSPAIYLLICKLETTCKSWAIYQHGPPLGFEMSQIYKTQNYYLKCRQKNIYIYVSIDFHVLTDFFLKTWLLNQKLKCSKHTHQNINHLSCTKNSSKYFWVIICHKVTKV